MIDPLLLSLFIAATVGFIFTPGPVVSLIVAETLRDGPGHGFSVAFGAAVASAIYLAISFFGFATVAALPDMVLTSIRYVGAVYLYFLAYQAFTQTASASDIELPPAAASKWTSFSKSVVICFTSPKTILFFGAFFPQFVNKELPLEPQLMVLSATFLLIAFLLDCCWVLLATKAKKVLAQKDKLSVANKIAGSVLAAGASILLLIN